MYTFGANLVWRQLLVFVNNGQHKATQRNTTQHNATQYMIRQTDLPTL